MFAAWKAVPRIPSPPSGKAITNKYNPIQTICNAVFHFPNFSAGMTTPFPAATKRNPVTMNSRDKINNTGNKAHPGKTSKYNIATNNPLVMTLSANASINFPKSVIWFHVLAK